MSAVKFSVKLLPTNMSFVNYSGLKFSPDFQNTVELSRGVLQKYVMKYLNFRSSGSKLESIKWKFTENHSFSKSFRTEQRYWKKVQNRDIEKCILMVSPKDNFILGISLNGCFSKTAAKIYYLRNSKLHIFYISYCDVMLKRNKFLWIFFT